MKPIRVLIADDHALLRAGLRVLLASLEGVEVVGEAADGAQALELVEALRPDILLSDIVMPGLDGLALAALVARDFAGTRSIILSMHTEIGYVTKALRAGASAYLIKDSGITELELAVRTVARGESYLSPAISKHVISALVSPPPPEAGTALTPRQLEILKLIAEGNTTKTIARRLDISVKTADTHRVMLMERLDIHDIAGLVRYAIRLGIVSPDV